MPDGSKEAGREIGMRILHTSDWHLGAYIGPQCDDPYRRMEHTMKCLDVLVETAKQERPDIILVAGDILHQARVWNDRGMAETRTAIDYLNALGKIAPVMVLFGTPNHDSRESFNMMEDYFAGRKYPYVRFFTQPELIATDTKSGPIQVAGLPGFDKGHFRAQFPGLSAEEENRIFSEQLELIVQGLSAQLDPNIPSVLMAHHTVMGCELDNGQHVFMQNDIVLPATALDNSNFDLVCLGHIHRAQRVEACRKPVYYAGSIDANTFNDEGHDKGFWIYDLLSGVPFERFIETPAREFLTLKLDQNMTSALILDKIVPPDLKNNIVRILYTCDEATEKTLDKKKLERDLYAAGAYYVSEIRPEKITAAVNRERMHEKLTVSECLERYLKEKGKSELEISKIMSEAVDIVAEANANSPAGSSSGMFLPVEIEVRNYRSYAEEKFSFEDIFFAMVNGKNGSGKSSLFMDAITDCLYEETREKELTGWIRNGEKSGSISFTFRLGEDFWRVTRTRQRSGKGTLALAKMIRMDGPGMDYNPEFPLNWQDHSCERLNDTQQKIIDLLDMDCDTFQSCVLIMQDRYGKFMEADKETRMAVLASLLGLGIYEELEKNTKEKLRDVNRDIRSIKEESAGLEAEVQNEDSLHIELREAEASLGISTDELNQAREQLTRYQAEMARMAGYEDEAKKLQADVDQKLTSISMKKNRKAELEKNIAETESFLQNEQSILEKCAELERAKLALAGMDGKVRMLTDKQAQYEKSVRNRLSLEQQKYVLEQRLAVIEARMESWENRERLEAIIAENSTVEQELEEILRKESEFKTLEIKRQVAVQKIASLSKQTEMLNDAQCIDISKAQCKFLKSAKEAKEGLEAALQEQRKIIEEIDLVGFNIYEKDRLTAAAKTYREAKDRLAMMAADMAMIEELKKQDDGLERRAAELDAELETLKLEIEALEKETSIYNELNDCIQSLMQYENMKMQLPRAKQYLVSTREQVQQLDIDIDEMQAAVGQAEARIEELKQLMADWNNIWMNEKRTKIRIDQLEQEISRLNQYIGNLNAKLEEIGRKKMQLQELQEELKQLAEKAAAYEILAQAFSQDGIPYQIIRDIVPELEASANEILGQMTGGRMRLEFVTERVLKSNKNKEVATLDIIINDVDFGVLPYLSRSGGQKVRAALAVNFALANIKASRVGLQLGMMFVDEPPFLDAEGAEAYCAALAAIHEKYPEMRILAISHDENMKTLFPQQLYIELTDQGSKVKRSA